MSKKLASTGGGVLSRSSAITAFNDDAEQGGSI